MTEVLGRPPSRDDADAVAGGGAPRSQAVPEAPRNEAERVERRGDEFVIDLRLLFRALVRGSWVIVIAGLIGAASGIRDMHNFTPQHEAKMIIAPSSGGASLPTGLGQLGALAGVAGLSSTLGVSSRATPFERLKQALSSLELAGVLQEKFDLLHTVYAGSWDEGAEAWIRPTGGEFERREQYRRFLNLPTWSEPSLEKLAAYVGGTVRIEQIERSPFYEVKVTHGDPDFASYLLTITYSEADELLRKRDRREVAERKVYLNERLQTESLEASRNVLYSLLTQEEQKEMMLEGDLPYAARIIDPPYLLDTPTSPNVARTVVFPIVIAVLLAVAAISAVTLFRNT